MLLFAKRKEGKVINYTKGGFPIWDEEFDKEHFTPEEIEESDKCVALIQTSAIVPLQS